MADVWIKVVPRRPDQLALLRHTIERKELSTHERGYELALERNSEDFEARSRLGHLLMTDGELLGSATCCAGSGSTFGRSALAVSFSCRPPLIPTAMGGQESARRRLRALVP